MGITEPILFACHDSCRKRTTWCRLGKPAERGGEPDRIRIDSAMQGL